MFILAISCLTTSSLPWFMDLTFQVPVQYCSLWHQTFLSPPDTFTTKHHFRFGPAASFFPELLVIILCSSQVAYLTCGGSSFGVIIFIFHSVHGVLRGRILEWFGIPSSSGPCFVITLTMICLSWVAPHSIAHSYIELCKPLWHDKAVIHKDIYIYIHTYITSCKIDSQWEFAVWCRKLNPVVCDN